jgi:flagellar biosynthesis GTPase FlhF
MLKKSVKTNASDIKKALIMAAAEKIYKPFLESGVGAEFINKRIEPLIKKAKYYAAKDNAREDEIVRFLKDGLSELINIKPPININEKVVLRQSAGCKTSECRVIMFLGMPGSGKTTTLAKLATNTVLRLKKKLALVSIDTYRVAATHQISTYSDIIGIPYDIVYHKRDIIPVLERYNDLDFIFIDTPGIGFKQDLELLNIKEYAEKMAPLRPEIYLVLSAGLKLKDAVKAVKMFSEAAELNGAIFTQTDNTEIILILR